MLWLIASHLPAHGEIIVSDTVRASFHAVWFLITGQSR